MICDKIKCCEINFIEQKGIKMEKEQDEIDVLALIYALKDNLLVIILAVIVGALMAYFASTSYMSKKYQSTTSMYVLNQAKSDTITYSDLQSGMQLTKDYTQLVLSRTVMSQVIADLRLQERYPDMAHITANGLASKVSVSTPADTRIIKITVTDTDPVRAKDIADAIRVAAAKQISEVMDTVAVNVVDKANLPEGASSPNVKKYAVVGGLAGFLIACAIVIITFVTDDTIKMTEDVEKYLELSVLGSIPFDEELEAQDKKTGKKKKSAVASTVKNADGN